MKFCLDRIEGGVAVCYAEHAPKGSEPYEFFLSAVPQLVGLPDGTLFEGDPNCCGSLSNVRVLHEETAARRAEASTRLRTLFERGKTSQKEEK